MSIRSASRSMNHRLIVVGLVALIAACGSVERAPTPSTPSAPPLPSGQPAPAAKQQPAPSQSGRRGPHADRRIELAGRCNQVDDDGFAENAVLDVSDNQVKALNWDIKIGRRGTCSFRGTDFRQVKSHPHIELRATDGSACKLMIWQEPRRVTLAHSGCERWCTPRGVYDKAWPVMFDPRSGNCARTG